MDVDQSRKVARRQVAREIAADAVPGVRRSHADHEITIGGDVCHTIRGDLGMGSPIPPVENAQAQLRRHAQHVAQQVAGILCRSAIRVAAAPACSLARTANGKPCSGLSPARGDWAWRWYARTGAWPCGGRGTTNIAAPSEFEHNVRIVASAGSRIADGSGSRPPEAAEKLLRLAPAGDIGEADRRGVARGVRRQHAGEASGDREVVHLVRRQREDA